MQSSSVLIVPTSATQSIEQKSTFIILPNFLPFNNTVNNINRSNSSSNNLKSTKKERLIKPNLKPKPDNGPKVDIVLSKPVKRRKSRSGIQPKKHKFDTVVLKQEKVEPKPAKVESICKTELSSKIFGELPGY